MRNKGFVLMETIIVISVLSVSLLLLYSSYESIIRKTHARNYYDTTEYIYKTYLLKKFILKSKPLLCNKISTISSSYECTLNEDATDVMDFTKGYIINYNELNAKDDNWIKNFDASTIDYLLSLGTQDTDIFVAKYEHDGEVYHSYIAI